MKRKRNKESHGNHIEIQAMSEIYNRPVELYCYQTSECTKHLSLAAQNPRYPQKPNIFPSTPFSTHKHLQFRANQQRSRSSAAFVSAWIALQRNHRSLQCFRRCRAGAGWLQAGITNTRSDTFERAAGNRTSESTTSNFINNFLPPHRPCSKTN